MELIQVNKRRAARRWCVEGSMGATRGEEKRRGRELRRSLHICHATLFLIIMIHSWPRKRGVTRRPRTLWLRYWFDGAAATFTLRRSPQRVYLCLIVCSVSMRSWPFICGSRSCGAELYLFICALYCLFHCYGCEFTLFLPFTLCRM